MTQVRFRVSFPSPDKAQQWASTKPDRELIGALEVVPNDAEPCPPPGELFDVPADAIEVTVSSSDVDGWQALWAVAAAYSAGGEGRVIATDVQYMWEQDRVHVHVDVASDGVDARTVNKKQATAFLEADDFPSLKELKARLKKK